MALARKDHDQGELAPYFAGRQAFLDGKLVFQNPHDDDRAEVWFMGWDDERHEFAETRALLRAR